MEKRRDSYPQNSMMAMKRALSTSPPSSPCLSSLSSPPASSPIPFDGHSHSHMMEDSRVVHIGNMVVTLTCKESGALFIHAIYPSALTPQFSFTSSPGDESPPFSPQNEEHQEEFEALQQMAAFRYNERQQQQQQRQQEQEQQLRLNSSDKNNNSSKRKRSDVAFESSSSSTDEALPSRRKRGRPPIVYHPHPTKDKSDDDGDYEDDTEHDESDEGVESDESLLFNLKRTIKTKRRQHSPPLTQRKSHKVVSSQPAVHRISAKSTTAPDGIRRRVVNRQTYITPVRKLLATTAQRENIVARCRQISTLFEQYELMRIIEQLLGSESFCAGLDSKPDWDCIEEKKSCWISVSASKTTEGIDAEKMEKLLPTLIIMFADISRKKDNKTEYSVTPKLVHRKVPVFYQMRSFLWGLMHELSTSPPVFLPAVESSDEQDD